MWRKLVSLIRAWSESRLRPSQDWRSEPWSRSNERLCEILSTATGWDISHVFAEDGRIYIVTARFPAPIVAQEALRIAEEEKHGG